MGISINVRCSLISVISTLPVDLWIRNHFRGIKVSDAYLKQKERKNRKIFASWRIIKETKRKTQYIIIFARSRTISRLISRIISENNPLFLSYLKEFPFTNFFHYRWPTLLYYYVRYLKNLTVCFSLQVYYCVYQKKKRRKKSQMDRNT